MSSFLIINMFIPRIIVIIMYIKNIQNIRENGLVVSKCNNFCTKKVEKIYSVLLYILDLYKESIILKLKKIIKNGEFLKFINSVAFQ